MKELDTGGNRQTTVTIPMPLFIKLKEEAEKRGISYNRHVASILEKRPVVAIDFQPLVIEMARLRQAVEANTGVDVRKEVEKSCQFVEFFLAEQMRRLR